MSKLAKILVILSVVGLVGAIVAIVVVAYVLGWSGLTTPIDNKFGDQHLKTTVALVELHRVRFGRYPERLSELEYTGDWDAIALSAVDYCANESGTAYYVTVRRGWTGRPQLAMPEAFWKGTGFDPRLGPCEP